MCGRSANQSRNSRPWQRRVQRLPAASLIVKAKLVSKTNPIRREELMPYQEFLVGFVYDVEEVIAGEYGEKQILVMHPAYIGLQPQSLEKFRIGKTYELQLRR